MGRTLQIPGKVPVEITNKVMRGLPIVGKSLTNQLAALSNVISNDHGQLKARTEEAMAIIT